MKETVYDDVIKNYIVEFPYKVSSCIVSMKCVNAKYFRGTDLGMIFRLIVEVIADNFANMVRDGRKIESIEL